MLLVKRRRLNSKNCFSSSTLNSFTSIDTTCFRNRSIVSSLIFVVGMSNADIQAMIVRFYSVPMEALVFVSIFWRLASIWHLPFVSSQSMPWQRQRFSNLFVSELRNECWVLSTSFCLFGLSVELVSCFASFFPLIILHKCITHLTALRRRPCIHSTCSCERKTWDRLNAFFPTIRFAHFSLSRSLAPRLHFKWRNAVCISLDEKFTIYSF